MFVDAGAAVCAVGVEVADGVVLLLAGVPVALVSLAAGAGVAGGVFLSFFLRRRRVTAIKATLNRTSAAITAMVSASAGILVRDGVADVLPFCPLPVGVGCVPADYCCACILL